MRFVCESCRAQYMINDEKVGPKGVKVRCRKCGYVILLKRPDAGKVTSPLAPSQDSDDAQPTQLIQTPFRPASGPVPGADPTIPEGAEAKEDLSISGASTGPLSESPGVADPSQEQAGFFGADAEEIGAVFDQVLSTAPNVAPKESAEVGSPDDRQSTRVIDVDTVRKLAEESNAEVNAPQPKAEEVPQTDWYVAINEKQTGPLTLDMVKEHWDRGEISTDSLCWRAGFDDWMSVSEVKILNSVLAPKPPKPIVVAPAATITQSSQAVVSVPMQSAFSSGGMMQTVQSEVQVPMSLGGGVVAEREESGSWKPSVANGLASLVRDEMEALARLPSSPRPVPVEEASPGALLELPREERTTTTSTASAPSAESTTVARPVRPTHPPTNPYLANLGATYSAPAVTQYRPSGSRDLMVALFAGGGVVLLVLLLLVAWLVTRTSPIAAAPPAVSVAPVAAPVAAVPAPTPAAAVPTPAAAQPTPAAAQPTPAAAVPTPAAAVPTPAAAVPTPAAAVPTPAAAVPAAQPTPAVAQPRPPRPIKVAAPAAVAAAETESPRSTPSGGKDEFDSTFGVPTKSSPKEPARVEKKQPGYIPPPPGAADAKESLGTSDIMEVVLANKAALQKCGGDHHGKIVMKWTIQTNGRTSNVGVVSEDPKGTSVPACMAQVIKSMQFPKHKIQQDPINFPITF